MHGGQSVGQSFEDRLNKIVPRITSQELLSNSGLGNEIGFYIFDYPPERELQVREHVRFILDYLKKKRPDLRLKHINLFHLIVEYLKSRKLLDRAIKVQTEQGDQALLKALKAPLAADKIAAAFIQEARPREHDLVLVSGIGSAWPLLRSHNLLNNLHIPMDSTPLVMFYPGIFTGQGLRLFGRLKESNYYRAFRLVP
jgi:hypothetical protein